MANIFSVGGIMRNYDLAVFIDVAEGEEGAAILKSQWHCHLWWRNCVF